MSFTPQSFVVDVSCMHRAHIEDFTYVPAKRVSISWTSHSARFGLIWKDVIGRERCSCSSLTFIHGGNCPAMILQKCIDFFFCYKDCFSADSSRCHRHLLTVNALYSKSAKSSGTMSSTVKKDSSYTCIVSTHFDLLFSPNLERRCLVASVCFSPKTYRFSFFISMGCKFSCWRVKLSHENIGTIDVRSATTNRKGFRTSKICSSES